MGINIKNVIGLIGLVILLFNGRVILNYAKDMNPLSFLKPLQMTGDPIRLFVLGAVIVAVLLILRYITRR